MDGDPTLLTLVLATVAAMAMLSLAGLRAWRGWLELRRDALAAGQRRSGGGDIAALRGRVRRLEAIATGLDG